MRISTGWKVFLVVQLAGFTAALLCHLLLYSTVSLALWFTTHLLLLPGSILPTYFVEQYLRHTSLPLIIAVDALTVLAANAMFWFLLLSIVRFVVKTLKNGPVSFSRTDLTRR
jgi:hypothetical protein